MVDSAYDRTYGGTVTPQSSTVTAAASTPSAPLAAVMPAVSTGAATPSRQAPPPSASSDAAVVDTEPPATRTTGGNKFEPQRTGTQGTTPIGGHRHSGSMSIGSALGKIVKGIKTAVAHE
jgi:hypothetical protein